VNRSGGDAALPLTPDSASVAFSIAHEASGLVIDGAEGS
jgi:hypothetical protein